jgi:2-haloacid dehalogenase
MTTITLAFDVYGTLIDTHGVVEALREMVGEQAQAFSQTWRDKQLEYSFRRGLMQHYESFAVCTRHALDYTCAYYQADLSEAARAALLEQYRELPAFNDVLPALAHLRSAGYRLFAFSNGTAEAVSQLLIAAGLIDYFLGVISVDEIKSFKPNPAVYAHFLRRASALGQASWLISSNPFDVIGAQAAGMRGAWVQRSPHALFDPWGIEPSLRVGSLIDLADQLERQR